MSDTEQDIKQAVKVLREGGIILYPTDTVWGIGCDATNPEAVKRIFSIKKRSDAKALISLVANEDMLRRYTQGDVTKALELLKNAERPTTIIYRASDVPASELIGSDGSIAVRMTEERISKNLCESFGKAIVSTSANISGSVTPTTFDEITDEILENVDYVMHSRRHDKTPALPSRILRLTDEGKIEIIRE